MSKHDELIVNRQVQHPQFVCSESYPLAILALAAGDHDVLGLG